MFRYLLTDTRPDHRIYAPNDPRPEHQSHYDLSLSSLQGIYTYVTMMSQVEPVLQYKLSNISLTSTDIPINHAFRKCNYYEHNYHPFFYSRCRNPDIPRIFDDIGNPPVPSIIWHGEYRPVAAEILTDDLSDYLAGILFADRIFTKSTSVSTFGIAGIAGTTEVLRFSSADNFSLMSLPSELISQITSYYPCDWLRVSRELNEYVKDISITDFRPNVASKQRRILTLMERYLSRLVMKSIVEVIGNIGHVDNLTPLATFIREGMDPIAHTITNRVIKIGNLTDFVQRTRTFGTYKLFVVQHYSNYLNLTAITDTYVRTLLMICNIIPLSLDQINLKNLSDAEIIALSETVLKNYSDKLSYITKVADLLISPHQNEGELLPYWEGMPDKRSYGEAHLRFTRWVLNNINIFPDGPHINSIIVAFDNSMFLTGDQEVVAKVVQLVVNSIHITTEHLTILEHVILKPHTGYDIKFETEMLDLIRTHRIYKYVPRRKKELDIVYK
jgi:hypothetical protein